MAGKENWLLPKLGLRLSHFDNPVLHTCSSFLMLHCTWSSSAGDPGFICCCSSLAEADSLSNFLEAIITLHPTTKKELTLVRPNKQLSNLTSWPYLIFLVKHIFFIKFLCENENFFWPLLLKFLQGSFSARLSERYLTLFCLKSQINMLCMRKCAIWQT